MTRRKASFLQGPTASKYSLPAEDHRLNQAGLLLPDATAAGKPLQIRPGVFPGPFSPGAVTVTTGGVNVNPFHAVVQGTVNGTQGPYMVTSDAVEFRAVTAASASEFRRGYVIVHVYDQISGIDVTDNWDVEVVYGPNAGTAGAATLPARTANSAILREFAVSNTGVITLVANTAELTAPRGSTLSVPTEAAAVALPAAAMFAGASFYAEDTKATGVWDATLGRIVWRDSQWQTYTLTLSAVLNPPFTEVTYGNAIRSGQFFRKGREVSVKGYFQVGSTTTFGATATVRLGCPPGYLPATLPVSGAGTNAMPAGTVRVVGVTVFDAFLFLDLQAVAANRRLMIFTASDQLLQGGTGSISISAVGNFLAFAGTYETAFEA